MEGYFKVHRKILDSQVFAHPLALKIWIWCLAKVTFRERFVSVKINRGETIVRLLPGQFIFGRFKAEEELNVDGSTIYKWIQKFSSPEFEMISIESNSHYSIITLCKWEEYQNEEGNSVATKEQPSNNQVATKEQPSNNQVATKEQPCNTNKNDKNDNNVKNDKKKYIMIPPDFEILKLRMDERNITAFSADSFFSHYEANGWLVGKNKMKNWDAALTYWNNNPKRQKGKGVYIPDTTEYKAEDKF